MIKKILGAAAVLATFCMPANAEGRALASWYGPGFHGNLTASGSVYNMYDISVAHKTLPFGTLVRLCNPSNHQCVVAPVTDRGPYIDGRTFDLSMGAAQAIGMIEQGVVEVDYECLN